MSHVHMNIRLLLCFAQIAYEEKEMEWHMERELNEFASGDCSELFHPPTVGSINQLLLIPMIRGQLSLSQAPI